jgi:hypothetical protein
MSIEIYKKACFAKTNLTKQLADLKLGLKKSNNELQVMSI